MFVAFLLYRDIHTLAIICRPRHLASLALYLVATNSPSGVRRSDHEPHRRTKGYARIPIANAASQRSIYRLIRALPTLITGLDAPLAHFLNMWVGVCDPDIVAGAAEGA